MVEVNFIGAPDMDNVPAMVATRKYLTCMVFPLVITMQCGMEHRFENPGDLPDGLTFCKCGDERHIVTQINER